MSNPHTSTNKQLAILRKFFRYASFISIGITLALVAIGIPLKMYFNSIDPDVQSIYESGYMLVTSLYLSYTLLTIG